MLILANLILAIFPTAPKQFLYIDISVDKPLAVLRSLDAQCPSYTMCIF